MQEEPKEQEEHMLSEKQQILRALVRTMEPLLCYVSDEDCDNAIHLVRGLVEEHKDRQALANESVKPKSRKRATPIASNDSAESPRQEVESADDWNFSTVCLLLFVFLFCVMFFFLLV
jgi:hypothetical protein